MRTFHAASLAVMLALVPLAHAGEYLPPPCEVAANPPPDWFRCVEPYVEMKPKRPDDTFSRAWYCESNEHSLGLLREGGCAGSRGQTMFLEWSVPAASVITVVQTVNLRDEIIAQVIGPCYLDMVQRNRVEGISDQQMLELLKTMQASNIEQSIAALMPLVSNADSAQTRLLFYELGKQTCINAARNAQ